LKLANEEQAKRFGPAILRDLQLGKSTLGAGENSCSTETTRLASSLQRKVAQAFSPARIL
jgi:hypothetical protein